MWQSTYILSVFDCQLGLHLAILRPSALRKKSLLELCEESTLEQLIDLRVKLAPAEHDIEPRLPRRV
jgi:hypothetical protein